MRKPTRRDLLIVIGRLQDLVGRAHTDHANDRDLDGHEKGQDSLERAMQLCIDARSFDPIVVGKSRGGWGD